MGRRTILIAGCLALFALRALGETTIYRIELESKASVWAEDRPRESGALLLFHRHPNGPLMSLKRLDVARVVAVPSESSSPASKWLKSKGLKPGEQLIVGLTGGAGGQPSAASTDGSGGVLNIFGEPSSTAARGAVPAVGTRPGARPDGTALFNPDRPYRPDWDSRRVPGLNMPFPASPNDYREGRTIPYPPASAVQLAPGQPPMMPPSKGEPPKRPN